ncbi:TIGR04282 family arsenosugar biosynthesis glycosyltransferase [Anaeromyxobacter paludicola]|uniref:Glycosyltransferase n=1 Tax=Anaeromyxobacter paludicola TaxID=2918171 RepID=A0ABM7XDR0_9BACT|nr:TIGR04282 family arsenosugar biosynthesis glycosyltransferase [Anaeromyxobacter paludicola]BDG10007.1 hypothetical protein AMPC_31200 [Anaeromyxobacter paludicola]
MAEPPATARRATAAILAKAPIPGFAKTRLIPRLGPEGAAALHALLLERTARAVLAAGFDEAALWCAPDRHAPGLDAVRRLPGLALRDQPEGDLGARMRAAFEAHLAAGPVVLVGTDCPALGPAELAAARGALWDGAEVVLVPAEDGGYAAIGLSRLHPSLFDGVPWGSSAVLAETRARIARLGWRCRELPPERDVDLPEDLEWLLASGRLTAEERARLARHL